MIVFDLRCTAGHVFEAWFAGSDAFAEQKRRGLVTCPSCGSAEVDKAVMAPRLGAGSSEISTADMQKLMAWQQQVLSQSNWVGDGFADEARAMHYGERESRAIHGRATVGQAKALTEEGVPVAPLPFPVAAPEDLN